MNGKNKQTLDKSGKLEFRGFVAKEVFLDSRYLV